MNGSLVGWCKRMRPARIFDSFQSVLTTNNPSYTFLFWWETNKSSDERTTGYMAESQLKFKIDLHFYGLFGGDNFIICLNDSLNILPVNFYEKLHNSRKWCIFSYCKPTNLLAYGDGVTRQEKLQLISAGNCFTLSIKLEYFLQQILFFIINIL